LREFKTKLPDLLGALAPAPQVRTNFGRERIVLIVFPLLKRDHHTGLIVYGCGSIQAFHDRDQR